MGDVTPKKDDLKQVTNLNLSFSPVILPQSPGSTSQKNLTGPPRIAKDIVADLYNNIQHWNDYHIQGAQLVKNIGILKSDEPKNYSAELEQCTTNLYDIVQNLKSLKTKFESFIYQIWSLTKLKRPRGPLFISQDPVAIAKSVETIANAYIKEFEIKTMVLENIAHSKNKDEAMFFACCWTLQTQITTTIGRKLEALLVETGHKSFK